MTSEPKHTYKLGDITMVAYGDYATRCYSRRVTRVTPTNVWVAVNTNTETRLTADELRRSRPEVDSDRQRYAVSRARNAIQRAVGALSHVGSRVESADKRNADAVAVLMERLTVRLDAWAPPAELDLDGLGDG